MKLQISSIHTSCEKPKLAQNIVSPQNLHLPPTKIFNVVFQSLLKIHV